MINMTKNGYVKKIACQENEKQKISNILACQFLQKKK